MVRLRYFTAYLKSLTFKRLFNLFLLRASYLFSLLTRKYRRWGMPSFISVEPTTSCNLSCPECPSGLKKFSRPTGSVTVETFDKITEQFSPYLFYVTLYFQGEPLLHKDFSSFVKKLKSKNIVVATSTNGHYLTVEKSKEIIQSGLDRLIISLDGTDSVTYEKYRRGGNYDTVVENIKTFMKTRKEMKRHNPFVELQFLVFKHNEHQTEEIKKLGKRLGVDKVVLKTAQLYEFERGNELMPGLVKYSRYEEYEPGKYRIKNPLPNRCYRSWAGAVITWDGSLVPCCFDKDAAHRFGNITTQTYQDIKKSEAYGRFMQQILTDRSKIEICRNCTER